MYRICQLSCSHGSRPLFEICASVCEFPCAIFLSYADQVMQVAKKIHGWWDSEAWALLVPEHHSVKTCRLVRQRCRRRAPQMYGQDFGKGCMSMKELLYRGSHVWI